MKGATSSKKRKKKMIVTGLAVGAAGVLGYFSWQYFKRNKKAAISSGSTSLDPLSTSDGELKQRLVQPVVSRKKETVPVRFSSQLVHLQFPLKKGSRGEKVRQLQEALLKKHGKTILPRYGADGDFGSETVNALKELGWPVPVDQSTFNVIVKDATESSNAVGTALFQAASSRDLNKAVNALRKMKSPEDYTAANEYFKTLRLGGGVRQTIVNGLLSTFTGNDSAEKIRLELLRIGLQYDGKKWSLPSLNGLPLISLVPTTVWLNATRGVPVPARMVLGNVITKRLDYTLFENGGRYFLVPTRCVSNF